jgi:mevalonate kinase
VERNNSKILLFGEYSLLQSSMALTMPYERYSGTWAVSEDKKHPVVKYSNDCLKKFAYFLAGHIDKNFELNTADFLKDVENGLYYDSNIPQGSGLGSSGALVVAVFTKYIKVRNNLNELLTNLTTEKVERLRQALGKIEAHFHGASSGIDPLSILLNKPLLFKGKDDISITELPEYQENGKNVIFLLNTNKTRNTDELVKKFNLLCKEKVFKSALDKYLIPATNNTIQSFLIKNTKEFYHQLHRLIDFQINKLKFLIPEEYQSEVQHGLNTGDYHLKICGAGGGGFILGFTENWRLTQEKLNKHQLELIYSY